MYMLAYSQKRVQGVFLTSLSYPPLLSPLTLPHQKPHPHLHRNLAPHLNSLCGSTQGVVDALLVDLGVSSMQLDTPDRGFSFRFPDAPLDMRMNAAAHDLNTLNTLSAGNTVSAVGNAVSAEVILNTWSEMQLGRIFREYGEEPKWRLVARRYEVFGGGLLGCVVVCVVGGCGSIKWG